VELLRVRAVAERLGVHENTVRNWADKGILTPVRLPGSGFRRFDAGQVERMQKEMFSHLAPADEGPIIEREVPAARRIEHGDLEP